MWSYYRKKKLQLYKTDYSKHNPKIPTLLVQLTASDNIAKNFWTTFASEFSVWNMELAMHFYHRGFPKSEDERDEYFRDFHDFFHDNPLMLVIMNTHLITDPDIRLFLDQLSAVEIPQLRIILMEDTAPTISSPNGTVSNKTLEQPYYFTPEEEARFYEENELHPGEQALQQLRYFTDGWPAAASAVVEMRALFGDLFFDSPDSYIPLWLEHFFFKQYSQVEMEFLVLLCLLGNFELELVQYHRNWKSETLEFFLLRSPIIRYNTKTKLYSYGTYVTELLRDHLFILSRKQKEDFYIRSGDWYHNHNHPTRAIYCYQKAGDHRKVYLVMKHFTLPFTVETARCYSLAIDHMPSAFIKKHPYIYIIQINILCTLYHYNDAYDICCSFLKTHDNGEETPANMLPLIGEAYILHSYLSFVLFKDQDEILSSAARAAKLLPNGSSIQYNRLNLYGDVPAFNIHAPKKGAAQKCLDFYKDSEQLICHITGAANRSWCTELASAELDYYTRNFTDLELKLRQALQSALDVMRWDAVCSICFLKMRYNTAKGNYRKTLESLNELRYYAAEADYEEFFSMPDIAESWLELKLGNKHNVTNWVRNEPLYRQKITPWNYGRCDLLHCYYLLENGMYEMMLAYIETSMNLFRKRNYNMLNIYLIIMKAIGRYKLQLYANIGALMKSAYDWCTPNHIIMPFIEFGSHIRPIIKYCLKDEQCNIPTKWLLEIDKKAASYYTYQYQIRRESERMHNSTKSPLENLTVSEQKLLYYISHGMTNQEMCKIFFVSSTTIKGMTQRLYKKIQAANKADASRIAGMYHLDQLIERP